MQSNLHDLRTTYIPDEPVIKKVPGGRYNLIILASKRAHALARGAEPMISKDEAGSHKPSVIALKEIEARFITWDYLTNPKGISKSNLENHE